MQIAIEGDNAINLAQEILAIPGLEGNYEVDKEVEKEGTISVVANIVEIIAGTLTVAQPLYQLLRQQLNKSPQSDKIETLVIISKTQKRFLIKDLSFEQLQKLLDEEKTD